LKRVSVSRALLVVALGAAAFAVGTSAPGPSSAQSVPTPSAPPISASAAPVTPAPLPIATPLPVPSPSPSPGGRRHRQSAPPSSSKDSPSPAEPSPTPTSPAFSTLDGTWEIQEQFYQGTIYSHVTIAQAGDTVTGFWNVDKKTKIPIEGNYDGHSIRFVAKQGASTWTFSGYVETASDMIGLLDYGKGAPGGSGYPGGGGGGLPGGH
jgi:hypothetical protein